MEENVPLEKESKKKFDKTVKGIKSLLKSGKVKPVEEVADKTPGKKEKVKKTTKKDRGVVYIGHIPHGFYEDQMRSYFSQFGVVTNVRVARSKKNGRSKGFGFVEFLDKEVAEIVASTMNNYLMDKRLLKAEYIPPDKQRSNLFKGENWVENKKCPGIVNRNKSVAAKNKKISETEWIVEARKQLNKLKRTKTKLHALGIDYDFFTPCDIPEALQDYNPHSLESEKSNQNSKKRRAQRVAAKRKKASEAASDTSATLATDSDAVAPKKPKKESRKEKSMNKPVSPVAKPPKAKKHKDSQKSGAFVRPLMVSKIDKEETPKKSKKNKKLKSADVEPVEEIEAPKKDKLKKKKGMGGIQKKASGKSVPAVFGDAKSKGDMMAKAQEMMKSGMVKVRNGKKHK